MHLTIVIDVDHDIDPARTDPQEIADDLVASYMIDREHGYVAPSVLLVSAEWKED